MPDRDITRPHVEPQHVDEDAILRGGRPEDGSTYERDGYDEAQRAEIAEAEGSGDSDGVLMTDMDVDIGGDLDDDEIEDGADEMTTVIDTDSGIIR